MPTRRTLLKGASALAAGAVFQSSYAFAKAPLQSFAAPGFYRIKVGATEVTALSDGVVGIPYADVYTNTSSDHVRSALAAAFQGPAAKTSVNAFAINTGDRLVLIDAGTGTYMGSELGHLLANLKAAGYSADQVDDVILTHVHTDHSGGLIADGKPVFSNATVHLNVREKAFWLDTDEKKEGVPPEHYTQAVECLTPYEKAGRLKTFEDNGQVLPGISSILRSGHTPGHSSLVIESAGEKMVFWGDITHGDVLQFDEPGVAIEMDVNQDDAVRAREAAFSEAADQSYLVAGAHISFPGVGHLRRDDKGYGWVALNYEPTN